MPVFNLQRYAPGEGFRQWHCDWTIGDEATEHHEAAERGKLLIFPASPSHIHRGRVNSALSNTIATGWINAGSREGFLRRLARY